MATLSRALDQIDPSPYVVSLTTKERAAYAIMRQEEARFISELIDQGARITKPEDSRRTVVVVTPGVDVGRRTAELSHAVAAWHRVLLSAVEEQGKAPTIGSRGATLPVWIGLEGVHTAFNLPRPGYTAKKVTTHTQRAYRGVKLTPDEALEVLQRRVAGKRMALAHSIKHSKHDRVFGQETEIEELAEAMATLKAYIGEGRSVSLRQFSGDAWRVNVRTTDGASVATSVATVALVPGDNDTIIAEAFTRRHAAAEGIEIIDLAGGLELTIRAG